MVHNSIYLIGLAGVTIVGVVAKKMIQSRAALGVIGSGGGKYLSGGFQEDMNVEEAAQILDINVGDDEKTIKMAHRKLILHNHPDAGGSPYISTKINEARDMLLNEKYQDDDDL